MMMMVMMMMISTFMSPQKYELDSTMLERGGGGRRVGDTKVVIYWSTY